MIGVEHEIMLDEIKKAAAVARKRGHAVLYSRSVPADTADLLAFFANGRSVAQDFRSFWHVRGERSFSAVGKAVDMHGNGGERFKSPEKFKREWSNRVVSAASHGGPGPFLTGGFSFFDDVSPSGPWTSFGSVAFVLPRYLLIAESGKKWLMMNAVIAPDADPVRLFKRMTEDIRQLMKENGGDEQEVRIVDRIPDRREDWIAAVERARQRINEGDLEKVVLSRTVTIKTDGPIRPEAVLRRLVAGEAGRFIFAFERGGTAFVGATPERLVKRCGQRLISDCLAGTAARGGTPEDDERLGNELLGDVKNLAEHRFVVEMIRTTLSGFCERLSVPDRPRLMKTNSVQHLYTPIEGEVKTGVALLDAVRALHPTPAMGGTPRDAALEVIQKWERHERGWYASPIGWLDLEDNGDFAVAIRSALIHQDEACLYAGCGIVKDSEPMKEYEETEIKFRPMIKALGGGGHES
ncbi:isochorismate synthase [Caenibacillus caldisaponilyticus]|uniref:isochorismate synthase n=1 Tax=Caenibacillus caldisaponilyticus TaxID=1674942 RepID=UPI00098872B9|nr:isochorismate synthase [Caenibacillus caldisaponilyticus]